MVYLDIVSGFSGAGKTTFVNRLLDFYMRSGEKTVYIVNEYGEAGLDSKLIANEGFESYEMTNGCICCTLRGEIVRTVARIIDEIEPTRIVFEPSGIFMFDSFFEIMDKPGIAGRCEPGNIITVIDGMNYRSARLEHKNFIYDQIKTAPILFISKLDKADGKADISEIVCDVKNINPDSVIFSEGYEGLTDDVMRELFLGQPRKPNCAPYDGEQEEHHEHEHGHEHHHHDHEHGHDHEHHHHAYLHEDFDTVTVRLKKERSEEWIKAFVRDIKSGRYGDIIRAKGVISSGGKNMLVNVTPNDDEIKFYPRFAEPGMTFIGSVLDHEKIEALKEV